MAGKGKKTFVAGEVLLAQDVNDYLMDQSVMNFATSAARSSAIPTPTEGMTTYVQDRNQIETFDGAEYRGMSGLQLVKKQAIDTGVSSVIVTNAFNATYENYLILISDTTMSTANESIVLQMRTGSTTSNTGYSSILGYWSYAAAAGVAGGSNQASWGNVGRALGASDKVTQAINIYAPFLTSKTKFSSFVVGSDLTGPASGFHNTATSYDQFVISSGATYTGGTIYVYGYGT
jgi:hypothetical protein